MLGRPDGGVAEAIAAHRVPAGTVRFGFPCNSGGHFDEEFTPKVAGVPLVVSVGDGLGFGELARLDQGTHPALSQSGLPGCGVHGDLPGVCGASGITGFEPGPSQAVPRRQILSTWIGLPQHGLCRVRPTPKPNGADACTQGALVQGLGESITDEVLAGLPIKAVFCTRVNITRECQA